MQDADVPLHTFLLGPQTVPFLATASFGHVALAPEHDSAMSHVPAAARQTVPRARKVSLGHAADLPVQLSAASHAPAAARQVAPAAVNASGGHFAPVPSQVSATSQRPAAARQTVPLASGLLTHFDPSQESFVQAFPSSHVGIVFTKALSGAFDFQVFAVSVHVVPSTLTKLVPGVATTFDE